MKKSWRIGLIIGGVVLVFGAVFGCLMLRPHLENRAVSTDTRVAAPTPEIVSADTKVLFTGTTFWGRRTNKKSTRFRFGCTVSFFEFRWPES